MVMYQKKVDHLRRKYDSMAEPSDPVDLATSRTKQPVNPENQQEVAPRALPPQVSQVEAQASPSQEPKTDANVHVPNVPAQESPPV